MQRNCGWQTRQILPQLHQVSTSTTTHAPTTSTTSTSAPLTTTTTNTTTHAPTATSTTSTSTPLTTTTTTSGYVKNKSRVSYLPQSNGTVITTNNLINIDGIISIPAVQNSMSVRGTQSLVAHFTIILNLEAFLPRRLWLSMVLSMTNLLQY